MDQKEMGLTQQNLIEILEEFYRKGMNSTDISSQQLVKEIASKLRTYVKEEEF